MFFILFQKKLYTSCKNIIKKKFTLHFQKVIQLRQINDQLTIAKMKHITMQLQEQ